MRKGWKYIFSSHRSHFFGEREGKEMMIADCFKYGLPVGAELFEKADKEPVRAKLKCCVKCLAKAMQHKVSGEESTLP